MPQVRKVMFKQIVPVMLDWRISYSLFQYGRYIHVVIVFQYFSTVYPVRYLVLFQEDIHDTAYRIFSAAMICLPFDFAHA